MRTLWAEDDQFGRRLSGMFFVSLVAHIFLFVAVFFMPLSQPKPVGMRFIEAVLVPGVPLSPAPKGSPDSNNRVVLPEPEEKEKPPEAKKEAAPEPPPKVEPKKKEMTLPVKKPTARQKEKEIEDPIRRKKTIDSAVERIRRKKANEQFGDPDGEENTQAYSGMGGMKDRIRNLYLAKIKTKVERNWVRPPGIPSSTQIQARIFFRVDSAGGLLEVKMEGTSGYLIADRSAMTALKKSAPFPPPPPTVASDLMREGIAFTFHFGME